MWGAVGSTTIVKVVATTGHSTMANRKLTTHTALQEFAIANTTATATAATIPIYPNSTIPKISQSKCEAESGQAKVDRGPVAAPKSISGASQRSVTEEGILCRGLKLGQITAFRLVDRV